MARYLIVNFDRYDTANSKRDIITADSLHHAATLHCGDDDEYALSVLKRLTVVDEGYACVSGEESDLLIIEVG